MRKKDRERTLVELSSRVTNSIVSQGDDVVESYLADAIYHEQHRFDCEKPTPYDSVQREFYKEIKQTWYDTSADEKLRILNRAVQLYSEEVIGKFNPYIYMATTRTIPAALLFLLNRITPRDFLEQLPEGIPHIKQNISIHGHHEGLKRLSKKGKIVIVPTHLSHLDSIVIGWILYSLGLPPVIYGAGLNLFHNPMLSFFMHNLGAYKVDRKKKFELYKDVLKEYCTLSLEYGYDNLFFPGGTRCRSGSIEPHLKLGLLGSALLAYQNNLRSNKPNPNIYIVPATLSYHLVLEAETLIDDFLQEVGKSRYIIEDDESTQPRRVYEFVKNLISMNAKISCSFGAPMDPFGNIVDEEGRSIDRHGRFIDIKRYVSVDNTLVRDLQRDREFTKILGEKIVESFHKENVVLSTHLVSRAIWNLLRASNPLMDIYRLIRTGGRQPNFSLSEVVNQISFLKETIISLQKLDRIKLDPILLYMNSLEILQQSLRHFSSYHTTSVISQKGERIFPGDLKLLFYYQNRLNGYSELEFDNDKINKNR